MLHPPDRLHQSEEAGQRRGQSCCIVAWQVMWPSLSSAPCNLKWMSLLRDPKKLCLSPESETGKKPQSLIACRSRAGALNASATVAYRSSAQNEGSSTSQHRLCTSTAVAAALLFTGSSSPSKGSPPVQRGEQNLEQCDGECKFAAKATKLERSHFQHYGVNLKDS